jgi:hypothetical protein
MTTTNSPAGEPRQNLRHFAYKTFIIIGALNATVTAAGV